MKKRDTTDQMIADAEALVGKHRRPVKQPDSTRELITEVDALLLRERPRRIWLNWLAKAAVCGLVGLGVMLLSMR